MRGLTRSQWLLGFGVLLAMPVVIGGTARADINTDEPGSIIVYPKVVADGQRDTIIHLTNTSNMNLGVHCFYTNAYGTCVNDDSVACTSDFGCEDPNNPNDPDAVCDSLWQSIDFDVNLTPQQPTFWRVSTGRTSGFASPCKMNEVCSCTVGDGGALLCPGFTSAPIGAPFITPQGENFIGELRCYEVDPMDQSSINPIAFNKLKGEAFIEDLASGEISAYNAITIQGNAALVDGNNGDLNLRLDRQGNAGPGEYNACATSLVFTSHGVGANAQILDATGSVDTEVTLVPCSFTEAEPIPVDLTFLGYDQSEARVSQSIDFPCYFSERLSTPALAGLYDADSNPFAQFNKTEIVVSTGSICWTGTNKGESCTTNDDCPAAREGFGGFVLGCLQSPGVLGVIEEFYSEGARPEGSAASSVYNIGSKQLDIMVVSPGD